MKKILAHILTLASVAVFFSSCTKVINIDLNSKDPQIVIDAVVTDDAATPHKVTLTKSVNFSESNTFPAVSNALITLTDDAGNNAVFTEVKPGVYENKTIPGVSGRTYNLKIVAEGKTYTSTCKMPVKVPLDSVRFSFLGFGKDDGTRAFTPVYKDPAGQGNYYRFVLQKGDSISKSIFLIDDQIVDDGVNNRPLFEQSLSIKVGDIVSVKMLCISKEVNLYFTSLDQNSGGPNGAASPGNPVTNINGAVLGYFSAHTVQEIIKQVD